MWKCSACPCGFTTHRHWFAPHNISVILDFTENRIAWKRIKIFYTILNKVLFCALISNWSSDVEKLFDDSLEPPSPLITSEWNRTYKLFRWRFWRSYTVEWIQRLTKIQPDIFTWSLNKQVSKSSIARITMLQESDKICIMQILALCRQIRLQRSKLYIFVYAIQFFTLLYCSLATVSKCPIFHGLLARWRKWRASDVGEAKEGLENDCDVGEATEGLENELWRW